MSDRVWSTVATLAFAAGVAALMWKGWRGRQRRQGDLPPPQTDAPEGAAVVVGATPGLFVGTTTAGDWLDRIAVHALSDRAAGWLTVTDAGVRIEREALPDLFLPYDALLAAEPGDALAGKVVGRDGLLLLTWRLGARTLQSGFRAADHAQHPRLAAAVQRPPGHPGPHPPGGPPVTAPALLVLEDGRPFRGRRTARSARRSARPSSTPG